jgi:hypothetical protein
VLKPKNQEGGQMSEQNLPQEEVAGQEAVVAELNLPLDALEFATEEAAAGEADVVAACAHCSRL